MKEIEGRYPVIDEAKKASYQPWVTYCTTISFEIERKRYDFA
jgi:hypothetical protein